MIYLNHLSALLRLLEVALVVGSLALATKTETVKGTVSAVAEKQVVVATKGEQLPFEVTAETKITLDGQEIKITALPVGSPVEVTAEKGEQGMKALTIVAMSLK